jgi:nucleoside-diphosphate-sugar epimerase
MNNETKVILVTGGTGFTGSHLAKRLLLKGHKVRVVDNKQGLFYDELVNLGADITIGSVTSKELVDRLVEGCDVVHHLAAAFREVDLPDEVYQNVNVNGTRYLLESAIKHGVKKFVYCSTCGVHGDVKHIPAAEDAPIAPADIYQATKYEGEVVAQEFINQGLDVTILRPTAIYGPGDPERWLMLFKRTRSGRFLMFGDGRAKYHPLYIDNLVDAFELAVEKEAANGQTYLIADEQYYSITEIVKAVGRAQGIELDIIHLPFWPLWMLAFLVESISKPLKISPPLFRRRVDWFRQNRAFDISKAKCELGYQSKIDLQIGLRETASWYKERGYL